MEGRERPEPSAEESSGAGAVESTVEQNAVATPAVEPLGSARPVLVPDISQVFLPIRSTEKGSLTYRPHLLGLARVHFVDRKDKKTVSVAEPALILPFLGSELELDRADASTIDLLGDDLETSPHQDDAGFAEVPAAAGEAKSYGRWKKELADHIYRTSGYDLLKSSNFDIVSLPEESERNFRLRLVDLSREERDERVEKLRDKYRSKFSSLEEKLRKAKLALEREREQARGSKLQTAISVGATIAAVLTGRKALSYTTLRRASTAARGVGESAKQSKDVDHAEDSIDSLAEQLEEMKQELEQEVEELTHRLDPLQEELETVSLRPRRMDVDIRLVGLGWAPYRRIASGEVVPVWR